MRNNNSRHEPRSTASCSACKLLKRRCSSTCIFAPYFRSDDPTKFAKVHKVFGASNVRKILTEVPEDQREETVNSLAYEAEARLEDPVYGCISAIASLQRKLAELQRDLAIARARLAGCGAPASCTTTTTTTSQWIDPQHLINSLSFTGIDDGLGDAYSSNSSVDIDQFIAVYGYDVGFAAASFSFQSGSSALECSLGDVGISVLRRRSGDEGEVEEEADEEIEEEETEDETEIQVEAGSGSGIVIVMLLKL